MELSLLLAKLMGPVFARFLFAYALRKVDLKFITGGDIAETLADSLDIGGVVDELSGGDRKARRNAQHIFDTIGDEVAERVAALFVGENAAPAQGEVEQAVEAAKAVMERRALPLLIESRFERIAFRQKLSATPPPAPGWSAQQRDYYSRLLAISADALFAAAEQIPHFTRDTTGQLLQDTGHLLDGMRQGLTNQREILAQSYGVQSRDQHSQFEQDYRTSLASTLDKLRLFGVPLVDGARQPLSVAFVKMRLARSSDEPEPEEMDARLLWERQPQRTEILSVAEAFSRSRRLVVIAPAGLGKTTLLRWAAVQMARNQSREEIPLWQGRLPFYLQLRDYSRAKLPAIADLPLAYGADGMELLAGSVPAGWAREQLRQKRAAIFVDGLDEINEEKRQEAIAWVEKLLEIAPETLFVLSGRPAAVDRESAQPELTRLGFDFVRLQPLDDEMIDGFVAQWHGAMTDTNCKYADKSRIPDREKRLRAALARRPELRQLAATPLIAAMLCALNLTEDRELPRDRIRLYNRCVDMLLDRDEARQVDTSGYGISLRAESARRHLGQIAFWMLEREQSTIARSDAARLIGNQGLDGEKIACYLAERSGLLQPQSQEVYDFAHRTFQEFLAAQHIAASHRVVQVAKQYAGQKAWRETISLLAGFVQPGDQKELLETLLTAASTDPKESRTYHLLAWAFWELLDQRTAEADGLMAQHAAGLCQNNGRYLDLSSTQVGDVTPLAGLTSLQSLDLRNTQVGDVTPLAGLTSLQYLYLMDTQVMDVATLAGLTSLQRLDLNDTQVVNVPLLAGLTSLQSLSLGDTQVGDVTPLAGLTGLQSLSLRNTKVVDVTPLAGLTGLQRLDLMNTQVGDVTPLAELTSLQYLDLMDTQVVDVTSLAGLTNLQFLDLRNTQVDDVACLMTLSSLQTLDLTGTQISDVTPLAALDSLGSLDLTGVEIVDLSPLQERISTGSLVIELSEEQLTLFQSHLSDLNIVKLSIGNVKTLQTVVAALSTLNTLQFIDLSDTKIEDVTTLATLTNLRYLSLNDTQVADVAPLMYLDGLQELSIRNTKVADVMPLAVLTSLETLDLSGTEVEDLKPLSALKSLQSLNLCFTHVEDVAPLSALTSLRVLYLTGTNVDNLSPLVGLSTLRSLYLSGTHVEDVGPLAALTNLEELYLMNTPVADVSPLGGLTGLQELYLMNTQIEDVSPLVGLTSLKKLDLRYTNVKDVTPLAHLKNLTIYW
ncbi:MAG: leucine-rich repeat domain-containing protein [Chloroflexi bacterium]|nr:leucine-rich repeat domain-containing protein [Chloroflexota bacterium]